MSHSLTSPTIHLEVWLARLLLLMNREALIDNVYDIRREMIPKIGVHFALMDQKLILILLHYNY